MHKDFPETVFGVSDYYLLMLLNLQVTGSHDKSLRLWERTEELLVIEEEREQVIRTKWSLRNGDMTFMLPSQMKKNHFGTISSITSLKHWNSAVPLFLVGA